MAFQGVTCYEDMFKVIGGDDNKVNVIGSISGESINLMEIGATTAESIVTTSAPGQVVVIPKQYVNSAVQTHQPKKPFNANRKSAKDKRKEKEIQQQTVS